MGFLKEEQNIWIAFTASLLVHGMVLLGSTLGLVQLPRFSVQQPVPQTIEVTLQEDYRPETRVSDQGRVQAQKSVSKQVGRSLHAQAGVITKASPDYFQNPPPEYPELARQMRQEGLVLLSVDVGKTGLPLGVLVLKSSGYPLLDQAARRAVSHWKFLPGKIGGLPIGSTVTVPVRFRLES